VKLRRRFRPPATPLDPKIGVDGEKLGQRACRSEAGSLKNGDRFSAYIAGRAHAQQEPAELVAHRWQPAGWSSVGPDR
jgi:hypothetical protein